MSAADETPGSLPEVVSPPTNSVLQPGDFRLRSNYRLARLSESVRLPMRLLAQGVSGRPSVPRNWRNGLILGPSHIGDVLYNTASLPALRAGLPNCEWTYAVTGTSAEVLAGNPHLREVIKIPGPDGERRATLRALRARKFDAAIAYTTGPAWREWMLALRLGIPNRAGYVHKGFSGFVTHPMAIRQFQPYPAYFRALVAQLTGGAVSPGESLRPLVYLRPSDHEEAERVLRELRVDPARPILACSATSRQPTGIWPSEKFAQVVAYVRSRCPCTVLYLGARGDAAVLDQLARQTGADSFALAGRLTLLPLVALLTRCQAALAPDSGVRHLANAAGLPVVFLRNLFNRRIETGAYCETDHDMAPLELELLDGTAQEEAFASLPPSRLGDELVRLLVQGGPL